MTRLWTDDIYADLLTKLQISFPNIIVVPFSDKNTTLMQCLQCQIGLFSQANIVIGMHGAGLANMIFMPPGGLVVEITPQTDGRMLPGTGIFSRLAMSTGINHYIHHLSSGERNFSKRGITFNVDHLVHSIQIAKAGMKLV